MNEPGKQVETAHWDFPLDGGSLAVQGPRLDRLCAAWEKGGPAAGPVCLDLSACPSCDAAGIAALVRAGRRVAAAGRKFSVSGLPPRLEGELRKALAADPAATPENGSGRGDSGAPGAASGRKVPDGRKQKRAGRGGTIFVLAALAAAALFAAFALFGGGEGSERFETYIEESAHGLSAGSDVCFRGLPAGKVESLSLVRSKYAVPETDEGLRQGRYVRIAFTVRREFLAGLETGDSPVDDPVSRGLRVFVRNRGSSGTRYLDLDTAGPDAAARDLPVSWAPENRYIPAVPNPGRTFRSLLDGLGAQLSDAEFRAAFDRLSALVSDTQAAMAAARIALEDQTPVFEQTMTGLRNAAGALETLAERLRDDPGLLVRRPDDD